MEDVYDDFITVESDRLSRQQRQLSLFFEAVIIAFQYY